MQSKNELRLFNDIVFQYRHRDDHEDNTIIEFSTEILEFVKTQLAYSKQPVFQILSLWKTLEIPIFAVEA